jgi:phosphatidylserine decarboxylase
VIIAEKVEENPYIQGPALKISIFMSVFNVHVNRIPMDGVVSEVRYFPGKFFNASFDKASEDNERNAVIIDSDRGFRYATVQIAGLIARRIICGIKAGDPVKRGTRFGLICFGSRLDVYLPVDASVAVQVGDKVQAGTTIIGYYKHG